MYKLILILLCICGTIRADSLLLSDATGALPVLSEGRFVPLSSDLQQLAKQLLWDETSVLFSKQPSLDSLMWRLYLFGDQALHTQPLFHLSHTLRKRLLLESHIPLYSYQSIQNKLQQPQCEALCWLIYALYLQEALKQSSGQEGQPIHLKALASGLWVGLQGSQIAILALPSTPQWKEWKKGHVLGPYLSKDQMKRDSKEWKLEVDHFLAVLQALRIFERFDGAAEVNRPYEDALSYLQDQGLSNLAIAEELERLFPLKERLARLDNQFRLLPNRQNDGHWLSLHLLLLDIFNPETGSLHPLSNLTAYPDALFQELQNSYRTWLQTLDPHHPARIDSNTTWPKLLQQGYEPLAGKIYLETAQGALRYPNVWQIQLEFFYTHWPLWEILLGMYALVLLFAGFKRERALLISFISAFCLHTLLIGLRCYLLERPPVTNMTESLLFVPWVTALLALGWWGWTGRFTAIIAAASVALFLIGSGLYVGGAYRLDHVQPVLNSQYWLTIHVLMVVSSYGAYLLAGVVAHWVLWQLSKRQVCPVAVERLVLYSLYLGTVLLIAGTLLGGAWAAQSWGRFWDWDPKESWAFVTSTLYLIWVHAYRFHLISTFGLMIGAVVGLQAVTFTWYGVNYVLGTGLHSYGFGDGGEGYYLLFIGIDLMVILFWMRRIRKEQVKALKKQLERC